MITATVPPTLDHEQFGALYRAYLPRVLNYLRLRVGDEGLAEELTAATFTQAFAKRHQLRVAEAFPGWLFRIARNELAQHFRRRRPAMAQPAEDLDLLLTLPGDDLPPEEVVHQRQQWQAVVQALRQLPPREQEIIELKFVAGLSNVQIAEVVGLTPSNVGVIVFRALHKLRADLKP